MRQNNSNSFYLGKIKFGRENIVQSGYIGLCVTVQLYSLPAWLAGAVNNKNREFVWWGVVGGWTSG